MTTLKLVLNTEVKATARAIGVALFNALLPQREEIGNRNFRTLLLDRISTETKTGSAPTVYNHAKLEAIRLNLTPDFSRSVGEKIGSTVEMDEKTEAKIHAMFDKEIALTHKSAQEADLADRQAAADAAAAKAAAKAAKEKARTEARATKDAEAKAAKEASAKKREEARALKAKEKAEAKEAKEAAKANKKEVAKKVVEEQPEMKWQLLNTETDTVVEYAPNRKIALELKKAREDAKSIKVVKVPEVTEA